MDKFVVGIDVAKANLDVHVLPSGEAFAVDRDAAGIDALIARLRPLAPAMVAVEATGGLESLVAASQAWPTWPIAMPNGQLMTRIAMAVAISRPTNQSATILVK